MTANALFEVTAALQARLAAAIGGPVYVGPPVEADVANREVALFLFHLQPNREMRNTEYLVDDSAVPPGPLVVADALPLDLRYLISVFRSAGAGGGGVADANELAVLGRVVQALHRNPTITELEVPDQRIRLTPEPYPMEEMSRVWGLFPDTSYRTSMVYLASPVFVSADPVPPGPPVLEYTVRPGLLIDLPDLFGDRRDEGQEP